MTTGRINQVVICNSTILAYQGSPLMQLAPQHLPNIEHLPNHTQ